MALATLDACFFCSEMPYTRPPLLSMLGHTHDAARRRDATRSLLGFMTSAGPLGDNAKSQQKCSHFFQLQFKICCVSNNISKSECLKVRFQKKKNQKNEPSSTERRMPSQRPSISMPSQVREDDYLWKHSGTERSSCRSGCSPRCSAVTSS